MACFLGLFTIRQPAVWMQPAVRRLASVPVLVVLAYRLHARGSGARFGRAVEDQGQSSFYTSPRVKLKPSKRHTR